MNGTQWQHNSSFEILASPRCLAHLFKVIKWRSRLSERASLDETHHLFVLSTQGPYLDAPQKPINHTSESQTPQPGHRED